MHEGGQHPNESFMAQPFELATNYTTIDADRYMATGVRSHDLDRRSLLRIAGIAGGTLLLGEMYVEAHPEEMALRLNLLRTAIKRPEAPLSVADAEDPRLAEHIIPLYNNLITQFGTHNGLLLEYNRNDSLWHYATAWPYGRALDAVGVARSIPGVVGEECGKRFQVFHEGLAGYWYDGPQGYDPGYLPGLRALSSHNQRYVDDNLWIALALVRDYRLTSNMQSLTIAKKIYELAVNQWDPRRGGIRWRQDIDGDVTGKVLVSNAPAAQLAAELFVLTGDRRYYHEGRRGNPDSAAIIDWVDSNLRAPNGLYYDNIGDTKKSIGRDQWTYGVGTVIGAKNKLNKLDPHKYPLGEILEVAHIVLDNFDGRHALLQDRNAPYTKEDIAFNAILFGELFDLINNQQLPQNHPLTVKTLAKLEVCVRNLQVSYPTLLQQSGALHLAVLQYKHTVDSVYARF
jgi:hypothetical protein